MLLLFGRFGDGDLPELDGESWTEWIRALAIDSDVTPHVLWQMLFINSFPGVIYAHIALLAFGLRRRRSGLGVVHRTIVRIHRLA